MDPEVILGVVSGLGGLLLAVGLAVRLLPVGECDRCSHCLAERKRRAP